MDMHLPLAARDPHHPNRIARPLFPGESLPHLPDLVEQVLACVAEIEYITCTPVVNLEHDDDDLDFLLELAA